MEAPISYTAKHDAWPKEKSELANKYIKQFTQFTNSKTLTSYELDCDTQVSKSNGNNSIVKDKTSM